jgi:hypothetical protein
MRLSCLLLCLAAALAARGEVFTVDGRVLDVSGQPLAGATVWLNQHLDVSTAITDDDGRFAFADVRPVFTHLVAYKEGHAAGGVSAPVAGSGTVDIQLANPARLELRTIDPDMNPVEGATVRLIAVGTKFTIPVSRLAPHGFPPARTDEAGHVDLPYLPADTYISVVATHYRYADSFAPFLPVAKGRQTVQLAAGVEVRGRVTDEQGASVTGALVSCVTKGDHPEVVREAATDAEGFYTAVVREGSYCAYASHPDYAPSMPADLRAFAGAEVLTDLTLPDPCRVHGQVLGPDDAPFPGVWVYYLHGEDEEMHQQDLTRADGSYNLRVAAGSGRIRIVPPPGFMTAHVLDAFVEIIDKDEIAMQPLRLVPLPKVTGTVTLPDGSPGSQVIISSHDLDPPQWAITDDEGRFSFTLGRMPHGGKVAFVAEHALRFLRARFEVTLPDEADPVDLALEPFEPDFSPNDPASARNDLSPLVDKPAPPWECADWVNSDPLTPEGLKGKVVVLTLWGGFAFAGPGRSQVEYMRALHDLYEDVDDVAVVSLHDSGVDEATAKEYIEEFGVKFPVGLDVEEAVTFDLYRTSVIPQTVLIDREGVVRYFDTEGRLVELLKSLLIK